MTQSDSDQKFALQFKISLLMSKPLSNDPDDMPNRHTLKHTNLQQKDFLLSVHIRAQTHKMRFPRERIAEISFDGIQTTPNWPQLRHQWGWTIKPLADWFWNEYCEEWFGAA